LLNLKRQEFRMLRFSVLVPENAVGLGNNAKAFSSGQVVVAVLSVIVYQIRRADPEINAVLMMQVENQLSGRHRAPERRFRSEFHQFVVSFFEPAALPQNLDAVILFDRHDCSDYSVLQFPFSFLIFSTLAISCLTRTSSIGSPGITPPFLKAVPTMAPSAKRSCISALMTLSPLPTSTG